VSERQEHPRVRLFLDTNTVISAIAFRGPERWLLRMAARGDFVAIVSPYVLAECARVLSGKFATPHDVVTESLAGLGAITVSEPGAALVAEAGACLRDPADAPVLAAAWDARADALVTGDKDLHAADQDRVLVIRTAEALELVRGNPTHRAGAP
jgi:putative PIN family toxin of toxin-antitoxin system